MRTCCSVFSNQWMNRGGGSPLLCVGGLAMLLSVIVLVGAQNKFPTYKHPQNSSRLCFMCPPGFYKADDCTLSGHNVDQPQWPVCKACPEGEYSDSWNTNDKCRKCETRGGSSTKCSCTAGKIQDSNGVCVSGTTIAACEREIRKKEMQIEDCEDESKRQAGPSCPPCQKETEMPLTSTSRSDTTASHLGVTPPYIEISTYSNVTALPSHSVWPYVLIPVFFIFGMLITHCYYKFCGGGRKKTQRGNPTTVDNEMAEPLISGGKNPIPNGNGAPHRTSPPCLKHTSELNGGSQPVVAGGQTQRPNSRGDNVENFGSGTLEPNFHVPALQPRIRKMDREIPKENERLMDKALLIMEKWMTNIEEVDVINREVFSFTARKCEGLKHTNNFKPIPTLRDGFKKWIESEGDKANIHALLASLRKCEKNAIADEIRAKLNIREEGDEKSFAQQGQRAQKEVKAEGKDSSVGFFSQSFRGGSAESDLKAGPFETEATMQSGSPNESSSPSTSGLNNNLSRREGGPTVENQQLERKSEASHPTADSIHTEDETEPLVREEAGSLQTDPLPGGENDSERVEEFNYFQDKPDADGKSANMRE